MQVAALATVAAGHALPTHAQLMAVLSAGRDSQLDCAGKRGHDDLSTKYGFPRRQLQIVIKIGPAHGEIGMRRDAYAQVEIASLATAETGTTLAWHTDPPAFLRAGRNAHLEGFRLGLACLRVDPSQ